MKRGTLASTVAKDILERGTQVPKPPRGLTRTQYRRQLAELCRSGVLRIWEWDGYRPELPELAGRFLYLEGPKWAAWRQRHE